MADHFVDGGAHGLGKAVVADIGRNGLLHIDDMVVTEPIEFVGGDPRLHMGRDHGQHLGRQRGCHARLGYFCRGIEFDISLHCLPSDVA
ncbi:hypothetical protein D3C85_1573040 [compost metagenome]